MLNKISCFGRLVREDKPILLHLLQTITEKTWHNTLPFAFLTTFAQKEKIMGEGIHTVSVRTDRSYQRDTDKGLNRREAYTINRLEAQIRNRKTEKGYVIGSNGEVIGESIKGSKHQARFYTRDLKKDSIVIHNHPNDEKSGLYGTMAGRIGVPFSPNDINTAVSQDLKEVRAVTPTYTWSMRRPKGGWGDEREIKRAINEYKASLKPTMDRYVRGQQRIGIRDFKRATEVSDRANVGIQYAMMKALAKRFGWEFTRRKVK